MIKKLLEALVFSFAIILVIFLISLPKSTIERKLAFDMEEVKQELTQFPVSEGQELTEGDKGLRTNQLEKLLNGMAIEVAAGQLSKDEAAATLSELGVVLMDMPIQELDSPDDVSLPIGSDDITLNEVWFSYDSVAQRWSLTGSGHWNSSKWMERSGVGAYFTRKGAAKSISSFDVVGISLSDTSGSFQGTAAVSSQGLVTDQDGWSVILFSPAIGDSQIGTAFEYAAQLYKTSTCPFFVVCSAENFSYLGKGFAATITYNAHFSEFHGLAKTVLAQSWNDPQAEGLKLGEQQRYNDFDFYPYDKNNLIMFSDLQVIF